MLLQHALASGMHHPCGCADLRIAIWVDIVHQEIDQPPLFLEHRQEVDDFGVCTIALYLRWRWTRRFDRRLSGWCGLAWLQERCDRRQNREC
jgi:hypothetical protein